MSQKEQIMSAAAAVISTVPATHAADERAAVEQAFEALKTYDYGSNRALLLPIDEAVRKVMGEEVARKALAQQLAAVLRTGVAMVAKEFVCAKLALIGSTESVPALADLLADKDLAHAARTALEAMPCAEAVAALYENLPKLGGLQKIGVINALGTRRHIPSVSALANLAGHTDPQIARAAIAALGNIGTVEAAESLRKVQSKVPEALRMATADACLSCAGRLLSESKKAEALLLYQALVDSPMPKQIHQAARRGLSQAAK